MRHFRFTLTLLFTILIFISCTKKEIRYKATCAFSSNIKNDDDIKLMIKQRLEIKDSIDYKIVIDGSQCIIEFYQDIDTSLINRILTNQLDDGFYQIYRNKELYSTLIKINDSLSAPIIAKINKEIEDKKGNDQSLLDEISITKDSIKLAEKGGSEFYPLFVLVTPNVNQVGSLLDSKSFCLVHPNNLDSAFDIFSNSSYFHPNTTFLVSNIELGDNFRAVYAINRLSKLHDNGLQQDSSKNIVKVFNNKVMDASSVIDKTTVYKKYFCKDDLPNDEISRYITIMDNQLFIKIEKVKITTR